MKRKIFVVVAAILALIISITSCGTGTQKKATELKVIDDSVVKVYSVGDTPDFSAVKAIVTYDDGSTEQVGSDKLTFSTPDTSRPAMGCAATNSTSGRSIS